MRAAGTGPQVRLLIEAPVDLMARYLTFVNPDRVARDALRAAGRGAISVIPGGPLVRSAFAPNRRLPRALVLGISKRMMARG